MAQTRRSPHDGKGWKRLAVLSYIIGVLLAVCGTFASLHLYDTGYFTNSEDTLVHELLGKLCADDIYTLNEKLEQLRSEGYFDAGSSSQLRENLYEGFMDGYEESQSNFFFTVSDMQDKPLLSSYKSEYQYSEVQVFTAKTYETVDKVLTEEEYETFSVPENAENYYDYQYYEQKTDAAESDAKAGEYKLEYDEQGAYIRRVDKDGNAFLIRFDSDGIPYVESLEEEDPTNNNGSRFHRIHYSIPKEGEAYYISGYVRQDLKAPDQYSLVRKKVEFRFRVRYIPVGCAVGGILLTLVSLIYLISTAGYHNGREQVKASVFDNIPYDVFTAGLILVSFVVLRESGDLLGYFSGYGNFNRKLYGLCIVIGMLLIIAMFLLWWLTSTAVRIRTGSILRNNLLVTVWKGLCKTVRAAWYQIRCFFAALPFFWQAALGAVLVFLLHVGGLYLMWDSVMSTASIVAMLLLLTADLIFVCAVAWNLHLLDAGSKKLTEGNLEAKIPTRSLFGKFRLEAQRLNSIGEGMNKAVNDRLKSEMFRTELIANVSHDIRTPLTSIINYTDLLTKLELNNAQAEEYLNVLSRQSRRLRKLTEDVLEASKATTGNIKVEAEIMDLRVLIEQMEGEYAERLAERGLTLVRSVPQSPLYILADGRLLWRAMDNLFGNICKYALEGTRVYLNALELEGEVVLMLRNISAVQLDVSSEELMERFVRGDRSRNTEGSGLGLSIAQSFVNLQNGRMEIQIDGDLFKVTLYFPLSAPPETSGN